jgi:uncharacterized membrane protein
MTALSFFDHSSDYASHAQIDYTRTNKEHISVARNRWGAMMTNAVETSGVSPRTWAIIIWGLYLASYVTFWLTGVVGVIIAYVKRRDLAGTPYQSHAISAIRTFWISLFIGIIGAILIFVFIGYLILFLLLIWNLFQVIRGLIRALDGKPIGKPAY